MFAEYVDEVKKNLHEDSLKHTLSQLQDRDDVHVCFITAYTSDKDKKANDEANKELEQDLKGLGYRPKDAYMAGHTKTIGGFKYEDGKIGNEPGYKVAVRNIDPDLFKEDMLALGKKYGQWSILLKLGTEPAAYYHTFPDHPERYGQIDDVFTGIKDANPQDPSSFDQGYTQMRKDKNKHPDRAFQYVQEEDFKLTEEEYNDLPEKGFDINSGNWWMHRGYLREKLGLPATHQKD